MKILIDIGHPAHIHYFHNFIKIMEKNGHHFLIMAREKVIIKYLLDHFNIPFYSRGKGKNSRLGKLFYMFYANMIILKRSLLFKPDMFISFCSPYAAQVSFFLRKPHISLGDTEHARRHLLSEGLHHRRIYLTGSPMKEVLDHYRDKIDASDILEKLKLRPKKYFLVSVHREENVDNPENLSKIIEALNGLTEIYHLPIIVSTHPRTRKQLEKLNIPTSQLLNFLKPFGFLDYNKLQMNAKCVISDSGTISEESAILNFPAISIRESMERPEAQDAGSIILTGLNPVRVIACVLITINEFKNKGNYTRISEEYMINNTSWRVLKIINGKI